MTALVVMTGTEVGAGPTSPTRADQMDAMDITASNMYYSIYPGASRQFYLNAYNTYNGEGFIGTGSTPWNNTYLYSVRLSVVGVLDADMDPVASPPYEWVVPDIYNNAGDGYTISTGNSENFFADSMGSYMEIRIKETGARPGTYYMVVRQDFQYLTDWDGADQYSFANAYNLDNVRFTVESHIGPASGEGQYEFRAFRESLSNDILYSGAANKRFGIPYTYSNTGSVTDVTATISFTDPGFSTPEPSITHPTLPSYLTWRINVDARLGPGEYEVLLTLAYTVDGMEIREGSTLQKFMVTPTPLLMPPDDEGLTVPAFTIAQKDTERDIDVQFRNAGNVDLKSVVVRLDLDNAYYIKGMDHYYNEENGGNRQWTDLTVELGPIAVGQSAVATFPAVNFVHYLPPGKYMVPVDYYCIYNDDGSTGNPAGDQISGYWQEKGYYHHRNIMRSISFPEDFNGDFQPFIMILVEDDPAGPDIQMRVDNSYYTQQQGANNRYIYVTVFNYEQYSFQGLTYTIHVDGSSPLNPVQGAEGDNVTALPPILRPNLNRGSLTSYGSDGFYFYADIKESANPGVNYIPVDISGFDEFLQPFQKTILVEMNIQSKQPRFHVLEVTTGQVNDEQEVTVTAMITNIGIGGATDVTCFFVSSSTGYESAGLPVEVGDLDAGMAVNYTFSVKAQSENRYYHGTYYGNIYFAYRDDMGQYYELYNGGSFYIKYEIYARLPDMIIKDVQAPVLDRGQTKDVTITVMNIGGTTAFDVKVMLPYTYSMFGFDDDVKELGDIGPGEEVVVTYRITTNKEFSDGTTYSFSLYFSYRNVEGRTTSFSEGERENFYLWTKDKVIPSESRQIVETKELINDGLGNFFLGLFILIGIIIFAASFAKARAQQVPAKPSKISARPKPKEEDPLQKEGPKVMVEEDEDEEEEDEEAEDEDW